MRIAALRIAVLVALTAAGCGRPLRPAPVVELPAPVVEPPAPVAEAPPAKAAEPPPTPPPAQKGPCVPGTPVDLDKLYQPFAGSFSEAGRDEMIGGFVCAPEEGDRGGQALVRRTDGVWRMVRYVPLTGSLFRCENLRLSNGRDLPICHGGTVSYGEMSSRVVALDFTRPEDEAVRTLVGVVDTTDTACTGETELIVATIDGFVLRDLNHDGIPDVRVTVRVAKVHVRPQPPCQNWGFVGAGQPPPNLPKSPAQIIDFIAGGALLTPTPAGARVLKAIEAMRKP
jgi:hypothetical protein